MQCPEINPMLLRDSLCHRLLMREETSREEFTRREWRQLSGHLTVSNFITH